MSHDPEFKKLEISMARHIGSRAVLVAISHDTKTFALVDYNLKVSLFKAEQFQNIK